MNKKHWNTIYLDGQMPDNETLKWIDHSYELVSGSSQMINADNSKSSTRK